MRPLSSVAGPGFPRRGAIPKGGDAELLLWPIFAENCMKMKTKMDREVAGHGALESASAFHDHHLTFSSVGKRFKQAEVKHDWLRMSKQVKTSLTHSRLFLPTFTHEKLL